MTQLAVASAAGFETSRRFGNRRPADRIRMAGETGEVEQHPEIALVEELVALLLEQELIDLSSAITRLLAVHEAMLRRRQETTPNSSAA
jgi:hypothetical protein